MASVRIRSIEFQESIIALNPASGRAGIRVMLEDGRTSLFMVATPDEPGVWMKENDTDFAYRPPILYVVRLDEAAIRTAVEAMARDMGGYWLRYYNTVSFPAAKALLLSSATVTDEHPQATPGHCSAVIQARLKDGREFSILTATTRWFVSALRELGLPYYYGSQILFVRKATPAAARKAVEDMARSGDRWFCLYDAPRTTLPAVLSSFKSRQPRV